MQATWSQPVAEVVVFSTEGADRAGRDSAVHQDQLEPLGHALPVQMRRRQLARPGLVR